MSERWDPGVRGVTFARTNSVLVAVGALFVLAAYTVLDWFRPGGNSFFNGSGDHSTFGDLHDLLDGYKNQARSTGIASHVSFGASAPYFGWLGWVLLAAAVLFGAIAASSYGARHFVLRWLGAVVGAAGLGVTFLALNLITFEGNATNNANAPSYGEFLGHTSIGAWAAMLGYLLIVVACLLPQRST